jgi:hypothetical protein
LDNESSIHGVVVDDSAFVAPARKGNTLLHLTTSVFESEVNSDDKSLEILAKSVQHLLIANLLEMTKSKSATTSHSTIQQTSSCLLKKMYKSQLHLVCTSVIGIRNP